MNNQARGARHSVSHQVAHESAARRHGVARILGVFLLGVVLDFSLGRCVCQRGHVFEFCGDILKIIARRGEIFRLADRLERRLRLAQYLRDAGVLGEDVRNVRSRCDGRKVESGWGDGRARGRRVSMPRGGVIAAAWHAVIAGDLLL